jgi:hypothetical protein
MRRLVCLWHQTSQGSGTGLLPALLPRLQTVAVRAQRLQVGRAADPAVTERHDVIHVQLARVRGHEPAHRATVTLVLLVDRRGLVVTGLAATTAVVRPIRMAQGRRRLVLRCVPWARTAPTSPEPDDGPATPLPSRGTPTPTRLLLSRNRQAQRLRHAIAVGVATRPVVLATPHKTHFAGSPARTRLSFRVLAGSQSSRFSSLPRSDFPRGPRRAVFWGWGGSMSWQRRAARRARPGPHQPRD